MSENTKAIVVKKDSLIIAPAYMEKGRPYRFRYKGDDYILTKDAQGIIVIFEIPMYDCVRNQT